MVGEPIGISETKNQSKYFLERIEIIKQIELHKLYKSHIINITLPNKSVINIDWKKNFLSKI